MIKPPLLPDELQRLPFTYNRPLLDTRAEERFDRITRLAARVLNVPMALITLADADGHWFKSSQGLPAPEISLAISFCSHAVAGNDTLVIPDTLVDPRFSRDPLVIGAPCIRSYTGHSLSAPDGGKVGTLCVMDRHPRELSSSDLTTFRDLAAWAESELRAVYLSQAQVDLIAELNRVRRHAMLDSLTRLWNREAVLDVLQRELARAKRKQSCVGVILADLDHFKNINDTYGHLAGDTVLRQTAERMRAVVRPYDVIGRYGGEEFLVILEGGDTASAFNVAEKIRARTSEKAVESLEGKIPVTLSLGVANTSQLGEADANSLIRAADAALYRAKEGGRNRVELARPRE